MEIERLTVEVDQLKDVHKATLLEIEQVAYHNIILDPFISRSKASLEIILPIRSSFLLARLAPISPPLISFRFFDIFLQFLISALPKRKLL